MRVLRVTAYKGSGRPLEKTPAALALQIQDNDEEQKSGWPEDLVDRALRQWCKIYTSREIPSYTS
jgi:hypothetical protein